MALDSQTFDSDLLELAIRHHQAGRLEEAMANCRQVLFRQPRHAAALHLVGLIARQIGRLDASIELLRRAAAGNRDDPYFHNHLADALRNRGQYDEAFTECQEALRIRPDFPEAYVTLGNVLADQGQYDGAIAAAREALRLRPNYAVAHNNLGIALHNKGLLEESIAQARQAVRLEPHSAEFRNNLGRVLQDNGDIDEAIAERREAIRLKPDFAEAYNDLGNALRDHGGVDESISLLQRSIQLRPDYALAHWNLSLSYLLRGDFAAGWREYEWRWRWDNFTSPKRNFSQPLWSGEPLEGKTILLHAEQGLGDAIQFVRYVPMVAKRGGKILLECQPALVRLFSRIGSVQQVIARDEPLPAFDVHSPLMSLPLAFPAEINSIPAKIPYLKAAPKDAASWKKRLASDGAGRRVGLVWAGSSEHRGDRTRSIHLSDFAALAGIDGNIYYSLQKGDAADQSPPPGLPLRDFTADLNDFCDTAAMLENLDLVISVDTAVAHLAGAMGKAVWVLVSSAPDWRWLREGEETPWYPTMRIFRQKSRGDWGEVMGRVAERLNQIKA